MILRCTCTHKDQDRIHGKGKRVHNLVAKRVNPQFYRCTVCADEKTAG